MPTVFVSRPVPERVRAALGADFRLVLHGAEAAPTREELLAGAAGAHGLVVILADRVDAELLDAAGPQLRVVANYAVGYDNVDLEAATERGIVVTNTPEVLARATAELTIALLLALVRRVAEGDRRVRSGEEWGWEPTFMLGRGLEGRKLLVVGPGRIGGEVARLARALAMEVVTAGRRDPLPPLLARADAVSLHVPLTPETRHLIDAEALAAMHPGAVLVNTSRGAVVDEEALVRALDEGRLAGAALDVYEREPEVHSGLLRRENVVLTPHLGSATVEAREAMGMLCVDALRAALVARRCPANAVNPEAWRG